MTKAQRGVLAWGAIIVAVLLALAVWTAAAMQIGLRFFLTAIVVGLLALCLAQVSE